MSTTHEELESFHRYAAERLTAGSSDLSLDELFMEWVDQRDRTIINEAVSRGLADVEAGRHEAADQAMEAIRQEFGFSEE